MMDHDYKVFCHTCARIKDGNANNCDGCVPYFFSDLSPSKYIKDKKEEKKMIVTIIGSYTNSKEMKEVKEHFERFGHKVNCPCDPGRDKMPLVEKQGEWIDKIKEADLVVAIPKVIHMSERPKAEYVYEFGESTSYEMAIAYNFNKRVVVA